MKPLLPNLNCCFLLLLHEKFCTCFSFDVILTADFIVSKTEKFHFAYFKAGRSMLRVAKHQKWNFSTCGAISPSHSCQFTAMMIYNDEESAHEVKKIKNAIDTHQRAQAINLKDSISSQLELRTKRAEKWRMRFIIFNFNSFSSVQFNLLRIK